MFSFWALMIWRHSFVAQNLRNLLIPSFMQSFNMMRSVGSLNSASHKDSRMCSQSSSLLAFSKDLVAVRGVFMIKKSFLLRCVWCQCHLVSLVLLLTCREWKCFSADIMSWIMNLSFSLLFFEFVCVAALMSYVYSCKLNNYKLSFMHLNTYVAEQVDLT